MLRGLFDFRRSEVKAGWIVGVPIFLYKLFEILLWVICPPLLVGVLLTPIGGWIAGTLSQRLLPVDTRVSASRQGAIAGGIVGLFGFLSRPIQIVLFSVGLIASSEESLPAFFGAKPEEVLGSVMLLGIYLAPTLFVWALATFLGYLAANNARAKHPPGPPTYQTPSQTPPSQPSNTQPFASHTPAVAQPQPVSQRQSVDWGKARDKLLLPIAFVVVGVDRLKQWWQGQGPKKREFVGEALWSLVVLASMYWALVHLDEWVKPELSRWFQSDLAPVLGISSDNRTMHWSFSNERGIAHLVALGVNPNEAAQASFSTGGEELTRLSLSERDNQPSLVVYSPSDFGAVCVFTFPVQESGP